MILLVLYYLYLLWCLFSEDFSVYCNFTTVNSGEITTVFQNIDVDLDKGIGLLYIGSKNNKRTRFKDSVFKHLFRNNTYCFIEVRFFFFYCIFGPKRLWNYSSDSENISLVQVKIHQKQNGKWKKETAKMRILSSNIGI